jgi:hypothetical protein
MCFLPLSALMMEAVSTFEASVNFHKAAPRNIPEDSDLQVVPSFPLICAGERQYNVMQRNSPLYPLVLFSS